MQVEAKVDEADIGLVQTGQYVVFTVDAFPDLEFDGTVTQIRFEPVIVSNVVTYTVIIEAENPNLQLMPGMTANIEVFVQKAENTLFIPYKAMRFKPNQSVLDLYYEQFPEAKMTSAQQKTHNTTNTVWVKNNNSIQEVEVTTGINNGVDIEVLKGLDKDDQVIVNMSITEKKSKQSNSSTTSPFMPQRGRRR
jgi:HlyD family secretion protein